MVEFIIGTLIRSFIIFWFLVVFGYVFLCIFFMTSLGKEALKNGINIVWFDKQPDKNGIMRMIFTVCYGLPNDPKSKYYTYIGEYNSDDSRHWRNIETNGKIPFFFRKTVEEKIKRIKLQQEPLDNK